MSEHPEKLTTPQNLDTGETILHLLSKEGKLEIIGTLMEDNRLHKNLVDALLQQDKLDWNPVMTTIKADSGGPEIMEKFLSFLESNLCSETLPKLLDAQNISKDSLATLLMKTNDHQYELSRKIFFDIIARHTPKEDMSKRVVKIIQQLLTPNSCELTSRSMKQVIDLSDESGLDYQDIFNVSGDSRGNNILMELAKNMKDDALRELLTHQSTANLITHSVLLAKNNLGQTLLTIIEVNRESLSESLPLVLKREYGCHRRDMIRTEICLSEQLETSASAAEIIQELHQLEPKSWCKILVIWITLFLTSLTPNIGLALSDIFSDAYLTVEYYTNMQNASYTQKHYDQCMKLKNETPLQLEAFASCLNSTSKFGYTITFLLIPLIFYLTEFLTLRSEYEPTGFRNNIAQTVKELKDVRDVKRTLILSVKFIFLIITTTLALIFWQPVTAICKFYRDARYEASEGTTRVQRRKEKRYVDLAASRGELIEGKE